MNCWLSCLILLFAFCNNFAGASTCNIADTCVNTVIDVSMDDDYTFPDPFTVSIDSINFLTSVGFYNKDSCSSLSGVMCSPIFRQKINSTSIYLVTCTVPNGISNNNTQFNLLKFEFLTWTLQNCLVYKAFSVGNNSIKDNTPKFCQSSLKNGIVWPITAIKTNAEVSCQSISKAFAQRTVITRYCTELGSWSIKDVNMTGCRLKHDYNSTMYIWLEIKGRSYLTKIGSLSLIKWVKSLLVNNSISYTNVNVDQMRSYNSNLIVYMSVYLNHTGSKTDPGFESMQIELTNTTQLNHLNIDDSQLFLFWRQDSCPCQGKLKKDFTITSCVGTYVSPCNCNDTCQCNYPYYIGDGDYCTVDSDYDGYPDVPLDSCSTNSNQSYCIKDNCPLIYNPSQNIHTCIGCTPEIDRIWGLKWNYTLPGGTAIQYCPYSSNWATRYCTSGSQWTKPNMKHCSDNSWFFNILLYETFNIIGSNNTNLTSQFTQLLYLYDELTSSYNERSSLPVRRSSKTLMNINKMVQSTVAFLTTYEKDGEEDNLDFDSLMLVDVFDDMLEKDNENGWRELEESGDAYDSTLLLENIEKYYLFYTYATTKGTNRKGNNIYIRSELYEGQGNGDYYWLNSTLNDSSTVVLSIPEAILTSSDNSSINQSLPIVSIQLMNIENFLATNNSTYRVASTVWSGQIGYEKIFDQPLNITFSVSEIDKKNSTYVCSYWNTTAKDWYNDGVFTINDYQDIDGLTYVTCSSYHLTAFAVLIHVHGEIDTTGIIPINRQRGLNAVAYLGCAASSFCLFLSILFFASQYKDLLEKTHMFIHLNLVIALFFAYTLFVLGIQLATRNRIACTVVAAFLHYFFFSSFCWMLCEGVMLYLLLVVVFTKHSRKWYLFMILGWLIPLIPVSLGLIIRYDEYVLTDEDGNIEWCWLSTKNGLIWAFIGPMLLIIVINIIFYCLIVWSFWRSKKMEKTTRVKSVSKTSQVISMLKGCLILLPLLGFTWLVDFLAISENTEVIAWISTIINSLQGVVIFFLYVIRNEKVWSRLTVLCHKKRTTRNKAHSYTSPSTGLQTLTSQRNGSLISNGNSSNEQLDNIIIENGGLTLSRISLFFKSDPDLPDLTEREEKQKHRDNEPNDENSSNDSSLKIDNCV